MPPPARGAACGAPTPEPTSLPLSTSQTSLPAATSSQVLYPIWAGVEAAEEAVGGSRHRRSTSIRVLRCCEQPGRAAVAGHRPELVPRRSGRLAPPRKGPGQSCSRWSASGKLRGALRWRLARGPKTLHHDGNYHRGVRSHCEPGG